MKYTLRALAALLGYPSQELKRHIPELRHALASEKALPRAPMAALSRLLDRIAADDVLEAQATYSELFDRSRSLSLHLFEHVHGDSRERGQALIDLGQQYIDGGYFLASQELPDFIPVFVEFASCQPAGDARALLADAAHIFAALEERLAERGSDYAAVMGALTALAGMRPDREAVGELQRKAASDDPALIDEEWEEKAVTFTRSHEMGGPTGLAARLRAAARAVVHPAGTPGRPAAPQRQPRSE